MAKTEDQFAREFTDSFLTNFGLFSPDVYAALQSLENTPGLTEVRLEEDSVPISNWTARAVYGVIIHARETRKRYFPPLASGDTETLHDERARAKMTTAEGYFNDLSGRCGYTIRALRGSYSRKSDERSFIAVGMLSKEGKDVIGISVSINSTQ